MRLDSGRAGGSGGGGVLFVMSTSAGRLGCSKEAAIRKIYVRARSVCHLLLYCGVNLPPYFSSRLNWQILSN